MPYSKYIWDDTDDPAGNVQHISEHGLTVEEIEFVLENPETETTSRSTGRPCCFGYTPTGDYIIVVYEQLENYAIPHITFPNLEEAIWLRKEIAGS